MRKKIILALAAAAVTALLFPRELGAYGAAHVGYTHVGPSGVYHTGTTAARGPHGGYEYGHTTAAGYHGAEYHAGYGVERGGAYGGGYHYVPGYGGAAHGGAVHYGYVR